ncbi:hypothetical protein [Herbaspirillum sp. SJZ107]|uniref:hypothetical protein n=1 Tax=Herbaspirillum sp. SJZ107 TaxID=2572881 RepID=UPI0011721FB6|nr:hypothetical protein [Herbaspirillum sp. SJZ107]TQK07046.1 hypothetical protein FBX97_2314 [Herbaspirillum sp. SJZ107]
MKRTIAVAAMVAMGTMGAVTVAQAQATATPATPAAVAPPAAAAQAQPQTQTQTQMQAAVQARAADVASIDAIVAALYDVISGEAGKPRDWNRMRSLFAPEGRLMAVARRPDGEVVMRTMTVEDYIGRNTKAFATMGFFEREAARTTETFGQIAHVFSTYESRHAAGDAKPFQRGINSIQLAHDGKRWWIVNLVWRAEDKELPLPERYLPKP